MCEEYYCVSNFCQLIFHFQSARKYTAVAGLFLTVVILATITKGNVIVLGSGPRQDRTKTTEELKITLHFHLDA